MAPEAAPIAAPEMYEVQVPPGVRPGQAFHATIAGQVMLITNPGVLPGQTVQVAGPTASLPTVAGVPVAPPGDTVLDDHIVTGDPVGPSTNIFGSQGFPASHQRNLQEVAYIEVEEISPAGWLCLIVGCFACPGLNLLGLCMRERRLVPVAHVGALLR